MFISWFLFCSFLSFVMLMFNFLSVFFSLVFWVVVTLIYLLYWWFLNKMSVPFKKKSSFCRIVALIWVEWLYVFLFEGLNIDWFKLQWSENDHLFIYSCVMNISILQMEFVRWEGMWVSEHQFHQGCSIDIRMLLGCFVATVIFFNAGWYWSMYYNFFFPIVWVILS